MFALAPLVLTACGDGGAGSRDVEASQSNQRWELRLRIPGEVRSGEMTAVELSLKNVSDETSRAHTDCISWFDLIVLNEDGGQVFDWRDYVIETEYKGVHPECPLQLNELEPGETLEQTVSFQVDVRGQYTVRGLAPPEEVSNGSRLVHLSLSVQVRAK